MEELKFDEKGLIPVIVQQYDTGEVLMLAYMNAEALRRTLETKTTWFWSRSRKEFWNKGATSGNFQRVVGISYDCDGDCLLALVDSPGPACHTGNRSCFYRFLDKNAGDAENSGAKNSDAEKDGSDTESSDAENSNAENSSAKNIPGEEG